MDETEPSAPRLARPYTLVGGRTRSKIGTNLAVETLIWATPQGESALEEDDPVHRRVVARCRDGGQSVAELAALLDMPIGVTRVLIGDLVAMGALEAGEAARLENDGGALEDLDLLKKVLANVERL